jgi:nucleoside diphosphate kinase
MPSRTEQTLIMIKPLPSVIQIKGFSESVLGQQVRLRAKGAGLIETKRFRVHLNIEVIDTMYPNLPNLINIATRAHLAHKIVHVFVFKGKNALRRMHTSIGEQVNPALCEESSLRYWAYERAKTYDVVRNGIGLGDGLTYWYNFVHRTTTSAEFDTQLAVMLKHRLNT